MFLEVILEGYESIRGQTILKYNTNSFGEIYHIHGDIADPSSIVFSQKDYDEWQQKKKYVSAKLLTYFAEHPIFIFGYGLHDPNVLSILNDIGEILANDEGLIQNVYQVIWHSKDAPINPSKEIAFLHNDKQYRLNAIHTKEFFDFQSTQKPFGAHISKSETCSRTRCTDNEACQK